MKTWALISGMYNLKPSKWWWVQDHPSYVNYSIQCNLLSNMQNFLKIEQKGRWIIVFHHFGGECVFELLWISVSLWMFPKVMMLGRFSWSSMLVCLTIFSWGWNWNSWIWTLISLAYFWQMCWWTKTYTTTNICWEFKSLNGKFGTILT